MESPGLPGCSASPNSISQQPQSPVEMRNYRDQAARGVQSDCKRSSLINLLLLPKDLKAQTLSWQAKEEST